MQSVLSLNVDARSHSIRFLRRSMAAIVFGGACIDAAAGWGVEVGGAALRNPALGGGGIASSECDEPALGERCRVECAVDSTNECRAGALCMCVRGK